MKNLAAAIILLALAVVTSSAHPENAENRLYPRDFAQVVKRTAPAVVNIFAKRLVSTQVSPFANDPFFRNFFRGFGQLRPRIENSLGSGVILGKDGYVVTNYHVVGQASQIRVVMNDRREFDAEIVLGDSDFDLAVLKLSDAADLPVLEVRDFDEVETGELVLAIGNPFGIGQTVSSGIVSGIMAGRRHGFFIQTDAPIYVGNSGGALIDADGRLVGINTSLQMHSDGLRGIGFAIPAKLVSEFVDQARRGESRFRRPWAGITVQEMDQSLADAMDIERLDGILVTNLHPKSPFKAAGLEAGDIIVSFNSERVSAGAELLFRISAEGVGESAAIEFLRQGKSYARRVSMMLPPEIPERNEMLVSGKGPLSGLKISNVNPAVIMEYALAAETSGVLVVEVGGMLGRLGLKAGDLLVRINGERVEDVLEVKSIASRHARNWLIEIQREGRTLAIRLRA